MARIPAEDRSKDRPGASSPGPRNGVLVLGMHRSGTSAIAGVLERLGCRLGPDEALMPAQPDNPRGFGERLDVYDLNEAILQALGLAWSAPAGLDLDRLGPRQARSFVGRAEIISRDLHSSPPWVLKDPRLCLLLPFWRPFLGEPAVVLVLRHPLAIAHSLEARNGIPVAAGIALWEQHTIGLLESSRGLPLVRVAYEDLLAEPVETADRLLGDLTALGVGGLRPPSPADLDEFVDIGLRHHVAEPDATADSLPPPVQALWSSLLDGSALAAPRRVPRLSEASLRQLLDQDRQRHRDRATSHRASLGGSMAGYESARVRSLQRRVTLQKARIQRLEDEVERLETEVERSLAANEESEQRYWRAASASREENRELEACLAAEGERRERLDGRLGELDVTLPRVFASRRWRLGSGMAHLLGVLRLSGRQPDPAEHPRAILEAWRSDRSHGEESNDREQKRGLESVGDCDPDPGPPPEAAD